MSLKTLAVFLIFMNATVAGYVYLLPEKPPEPVARVLPDVPTLTLLSERDEATMRQLVQEPVPASVPAPVPTSGQPLATATDADASVTPALPDLQSLCKRLGPFDAQTSAQSALGKIAALASKAQIQQIDDMQASGYWVYLPSQKVGADGRDAALVMARQLSAAKVRDYYVVTTGENENTISLGVFRDAFNADKRMAEVAALGFYPKRQERGEPIKRFYVEYTVDANRQTLMGQLIGRFNGLRNEAINCPN
jgi:hypothetical protein